MTVLCLLEAQGGSLAKDNWYRGKAQVNPLKTKAKLHPIEQKMNQKKKKKNQVLPFTTFRGDTII